MLVAALKTRYGSRARGQVERKFRFVRWGKFNARHNCAALVLGPNVLNPVLRIHAMRDNDGDLPLSDSHNWHVLRCIELSRCRSSVHDSGSSGLLGCHFDFPRGRGAAHIRSFGPHFLVPVVELDVVAPVGVHFRHHPGIPRRALPVVQRLNPVPVAGGKARSRVRSLLGGQERAEYEPRFRVGPQALRGGDSELLALLSGLFGFAGVPPDRAPLRHLHVRRKHFGLLVAVQVVQVKRSAVAVHRRHGRQVPGRAFGELGLHFRPHDNLAVCYSCRRGRLRGRRSCRCRGGRCGRRGGRGRCGLGLCRGLLGGLLRGGEGEG
mmetsp:Transcript_65300/g.131334  ORF Transcript_65300/g.131334 Transcript_65300/m.131334 type:complete len:322 (+) Transcript_65300:217-1182(+)